MHSTQKRQKTPHLAMCVTRWNPNQTGASAARSVSQLNLSLAFQQHAMTFLHLFQRLGKSQYFLGWKLFYDFLRL